MDDKKNIRCQFQPRTGWSVKILSNNKTGSWTENGWEPLVQMTQRTIRYLLSTCSNPMKITLIPKAEKRRKLWQRETKDERMDVRNQPHNRFC